MFAGKIACAIINNAAEAGLELFIVSRKKVFLH